MRKYEHCFDCRVRVFTQLLPVLRPSCAYFLPGLTPKVIRVIGGLTSEPLRVLADVARKSAKMNTYLRCSGRLQFFFYRNRARSTRLRWSWCASEVVASRLQVYPEDTSACERSRCSSIHGRWHCSILPRRYSFHRRERSAALFFFPSREIQCTNERKRVAIDPT